jgi:hypothetical protein
MAGTIICSFVPSSMEQQGWTASSLHETKQLTLYVQQRHMSQMSLFSYSELLT